MIRRAATSRLKRLLTEPGPRSLAWYYAVGGLVSKGLPANRKYGDFVALLDELVDSFDCQAFSRESKITTLRGVLDTSQAFHEAYTAAEVQELESPPNGAHRLSWNHLRVLARLPAAERQRMQSAAIKGRWSSSRLMRELQLRNGRKNRGGRRTRKSADARQALQALIRESERWLQRVEADWVTVEPTTPKHELGTDEPSANLIAEARAAVAELEKRSKDMKRILSEE